MEQNEPTRVRIVDVDVPFGSLVGLCMKVALASIPAVGVLAVLAFAVVAVLGGLRQ